MGRGEEGEREKGEKKKDRVKAYIHLLTSNLLFREGGEPRGRKKKREKHGLVGLLAVGRDSTSGKRGPYNLETLPGFGGGGKKKKKERGETEGDSEGYLWFSLPFLFPFGEKVAGRSRSGGSGRRRGKREKKEGGRGEKKREASPFATVINTIPSSVTKKGGLMPSTASPQGTGTKKKKKRKKKKEKKR